ncbi:MAG: glutamine--fructose-6-phosphate transaminase (isomerizing) [Solirubrobacteraceae bacterium]|nr:glutamine--fructose-6-phosphate transaminase (isomerizing) [Solirubrobacteraceae bacterium]
MCGIVGYLGPRDLDEVLLQGLRRLEYRGYDSAGLAGLGDDGTVAAVRAVGNLDNLESALDRTGGLHASSNGSGAHTGIGHTRWATHGKVTEANAHPHFDTADQIHVVVNGIVENFAGLRARLSEEGATFTSETDVEVIAHLIASYGPIDLLEAVQRAVTELEGHFAFVVMSAREPGRLIAFRKECPLVIGQGDGEVFLGSAIPAFLRYTRQAVAIENGEVVDISAKGGVRIYDARGNVVERAAEEVEWDDETAEKGGFDTFMLKEIHEQADAVAETIADRTWQPASVDFGAEFDLSILEQATRIVIVACGTSYHAGLLGRYVMETYARVPVDVEVASEYRYREPVLEPTDVVIGITQSGETADTLAAMRVAREQGAKVLAITNVMGSQATRDADGVIFTRAGLEIGVAATKTFLCQLAVMYLLGIKLGEVRGTMAVERRRELIAGLKAVPSAITELLEQSADSIARAADAHYAANFFLYLGRHVGLPIALEGALKLKEVSYIATDAYAAGEMKHGPIALLDDDTPVVVVATNSPVREKVISNIQEVRARGAHVLAVVTAGDEAAMSEHSDEVFPVPLTDWTLQPLLAVIPLQLLAYEIAVRRGLNVDQPRNLAKTVTVE